ncbi:MAG TPA: hypothetical protein VLD65_07535 [Anaerolineales bacterium]|nr:hypothetical protein [Anaerolineales bacterium]
MRYSKFFFLFVVVLLIIPTSNAMANSMLIAPSPEESYLSPEIIISQDTRNDYSPAIAFNSKHSEYLVVWESVGPGGYKDIYAQRVSSDGRLLSWFAVGTFLNSKMEPSVAYDPVNDRYLVVWSYDFYGTGTDWDVYGRFIPWNGPDPGLIDFSICGWSSNQSHAVVTYGRVFEEFMVVWRSAASGVSGYISGRIVFAGGSMGADFTISSGPEHRDFPDVTYNFTRNEFLVVWDKELSAHNMDIYGRRLQGNGTPIGDEFSIAGWPDSEERPAVAACFETDQYMVAWQSDQGTVGSDYAIYARYLNGDAIPGYVTLIDDTTSPELNVAIACNRAGKQYMLVWQTQYVSQLNGIWARKAFPDGSLGDPFAVRVPNNLNCEYPAISAGSSSYLVAWEHQNLGQTRDIHGRLLRYTIFLPITLRH